MEMRETLVDNFSDCDFSVFSVLNKFSFYEFVPLVISCVIESMFVLLVTGNGHILV